MDWWGWGSPPNDPSNLIPKFEDFLQNFGGSRWLNTVIQYYGPTGGAGNPTNFWGGEWFDNTNPLPVGTNGLPCTRNSDCATNKCNVGSGKCYPTYEQFKTEVNQAASHFQAVEDGIVFVAMPPAIPWPGTWRHDSVARTGHANIVYVEAAYSDSTPGIEHEIAEAITNPRARFEGDTWVDECACEIVDKCDKFNPPWISVGESPTQNYQVTELWSDDENVCVYSYLSHTDVYWAGSGLIHSGNNFISTDNYGQPPNVGLNSTPGAVSWSQGRQDAFVYGSDLNVWQWRQGPGVSAGWYPWGHPPGTLQTQYSPDAFSWRPQREDVVVVARNGSGVNEFWRKAYKNGTWLDWTKVGSGSPPTSAIGSRAATATWGPNRFDIFFLSTESPPHVRHAYSDDDGANVYWDDWGNQSGVVFTRVDAASRGNLSVDVVVLGNDGNVWQRNWDHYNFYGWFNFGNPGSSFLRGPGAVGMGDGRIWVYSATEAGEAYERYWDNGLFPAWFDEGPTGSGSGVTFDVSAW
jgi:hypothetical protein